MQLNAMTETMGDHFLSAIEKLKEMPRSELRAVVITGVFPLLCSDRVEPQQRPDPTKLIHDLMSLPLRTLRTLPATL